MNDVALMNRLQEELLSLPEHQRKHLLSVVGLETSKESVQLDREQNVVLEALNAVCDRQIGWSFVSGGKDSYGKTKYNQKVQDIYEVVEPARCYLNQAQLDSLVKTCVRCLSRWMRDCGVPVTPTNVLNHTGNLKHAVDTAFPGYLEAGILHRVA